MNQTKIEYLTHTCNMVVGCSGEGCAVREHCWALWQAKRQKPHYDIDGTLIRGCELCYSFIPHYHPERLWQPLKRRKPARIGLCFMGELYNKAVPTLVIKQVFEMASKASWHEFLSLTKQPQNIPKRMSIPRNLAIGVTVNRREDLWRVHDLQGIDAELKVASFEPLMEDLGEISLDGIGWVIIGAMSRPNIQPRGDWVQNLIKQAKQYDIPIFLKDNLTNGYLKEYPASWRLERFDL